MNRKLFRRLIATAIIAAAALTAHAQTAQVKQPIRPSTASVQYMGISRNILSVAVQYNNDQGRRFVVTVSDQDGYLLFQGCFAEKRFNKIFQLPKQEASKLIFSIRSADSGESQSFEVSTKNVEDNIVKRAGWRPEE